MYSEQITQRLALANGIKPQTLNSSNAQTDAIDLSKASRAFFVVTIGANAGTLGLYLQESAASGSGFPGSASTASPFSGSSGNNVSQTGITGNTTVSTFEVRADQLTPGKQYVRLSAVESAGSNCVVSVVAWSDEGYHKPNNANNGANIATQNVVS
jgi:hypothetical protein